MSYVLTQDAAGFKITAGGRTEMFVVGVAGDGRQRDVSFANGEPNFTGSGLGKLIDLGLWQYGSSPSGGLCRRLLAEANIDFASWSAKAAQQAQLAASTVSAPGTQLAPATTRVAATLEQVKCLPGAKEFPNAADALVTAGATLEEAKSILAFVLRESTKNDPGRTCNSAVGLIFNPVEI